MPSKPSQSRKRSQRPDASTAVTISVRVQPRASRNSVVLEPDGSCRVRLTAPPVDGAANEALATLLAETFAVGRSQIEIVAGKTGRQKIIRINGVDAVDLERVLKQSSK